MCRINWLVRTVCTGMVCLTLVSAASAGFNEGIYWTQWSSGVEGVYRANANGTGVTQIVDVAINSLDGLAIDPVEKKLYIGTSYDLLRCNLDGSDLETICGGGVAFDFYGLAIDAVNRKIYWSDWIPGGRTPGIRMANLDGTSVETVFEGTVTKGKAIDSEAEKLYWIANSIYKSDLDGSNAVEILPNTFGQGGLSGLALDVPNGKMYFTTWDDGGIWRANMDGTNPECLLPEKTNSIVVYSEAGKIYWTSWADSPKDIKRANLDGSGEEIVCSMSGSGNSMVINVVPEPSSVVLIFGGLLCLAFYGRRRKK